MFVIATVSAEHFNEDCYDDGGLLFCKLFSHSISHVRVENIKHPMKSKKKPTFKIKHWKWHKEENDNNKKQNKQQQKPTQITFLKARINVKT